MKNSESSMIIAGVCALLGGVFILIGIFGGLFLW